MRKTVTWVITAETDEPLRDIRRPVAVVIRDGHATIVAATAKIAKWRYVQSPSRGRRK